MKKKHTKDSRRICVSSPRPPFPVPSPVIRSERLPLLPQRVGNGNVAVMVPVLNVIIISKRKKERKKKKKHTKGLETHVRLESPIPCSLLDIQYIPCKSAAPQHVGGDVAIGVVLGVVDGRNKGEKEQRVENINMIM
jgi:hypothetical protein